MIVVTAQFFSSFFIEKVTKVHQATHTCPLAVFSGPCLNQSYDYILCTVDDIRRVIIQSPGKSCDLDLLTHSLLMTSLKDIHSCTWYAIAPSALEWFLSVKRSRSSHPSWRSLDFTQYFYQQAGYQHDVSVKNWLYVLSVLGWQPTCSTITFKPQQSAYREHHSTDAAILKIASTSLMRYMRTKLQYWY